MPRTLQPNPTRDEFVALAKAARAGRTDADPHAVVAIPVGVRLLSDQLTPVLAYRRLVARDERTAPSFLFESVEGGDRQGRYSVLGAHPSIEVRARGSDVEVRRRAAVGSGAAHHPDDTLRETSDDPLGRVRAETAHLRFLRPPGRPGRLLPDAPLGGWFGFASYDSVRYAEPERLGWDRAPADDRSLPDVHFGFYDRVVVFDHVEKVVHAVRLAFVPEGSDPGAAHDAAAADLARTVDDLQTHSKPLPAGLVGPGLDAAFDPASLRSNLTRDDHAAMVERAREYIRAGDIFQVVLGQRFERTSPADPFDVYRALRAVNPSPYMAYLQASGCILVASSPEILCRVRRDGPADELVLTNRPLAGTRKRGSTDEEDVALERELLADEKERAEHVMLLDLGRNDVGKVARLGSVDAPAVMEIERYSHVMHISSTVTGVLRDGLDCWDALRATLPVGTISGAPKLRAMQIIDELETVRRGPYGGGFGYVSADGEMDIALALRTIVVPTHYRPSPSAWRYDIQASGGIVYDSDPGAEYDETVNKASAMVRAIDLAESAFGSA